MGSFYLALLQGDLFALLIATTAPQNTMIRLTILAMVVAVAAADTWEVYVRTSNIEYANVDDSDVYIELYGSAGASGPLLLDASGRDDLERGHTDKFTFTFSDVGEVDRLRVWLDGTDGWHGEDIVLYNSNTHAEYTFLVNRWLDDEEDGTHATLYPSKTTILGKSL